MHTCKHTLAHTHITHTPQATAATAAAAPTSPTAQALHITAAANAASEPSKYLLEVSACVCVDGYDYKS